MARYFKIVSGKTVSTIKHSTGPEDVQEGVHNGKIIYCAKIESPWAQKIIFKTISFKPNGGTGTMNDAMIMGSSFKLPLTTTFNPPTDMEFDGWSYTEGGPKIEAPVIRVEEDITLYAVWKKVMCKVSFSPSSPSGEGTGIMEPVFVEKGSTYTLPPCTFTAPSTKTFSAWSKSYGGLPIYADTTKITGDTTLYANWEDLIKLYLEKGEHATLDPQDTVIIYTPATSQYPLPTVCPYTPDPGWKFVYWTDSEGFPLTDWLVTVQTETHVIAKYVKDT